MTSEEAKKTWIWKDHKYKTIQIVAYLGDEENVIVLPHLRRKLPPYPYMLPFPATVKALYRNHGPGMEPKRTIIQCGSGRCPPKKHNIDVRTAVKLQQKHTQKFNVKRISSLE